MARGRRALVAPVSVRSAREYPLRSAPWPAGAVLRADHVQAGLRYGSALPPEGWLEMLAGWGLLPAQDLADRLLDGALQLDHERPHDDLSILVVGVYPAGDARGARRLAVRLPLDG